ncbi:MAG TPA: DUF6167 family protein [Arachnia sp.]|nr:DUF6167 family protein [Arachnia sp.]HMT87868.1 DUF6167 family protein [Arachnia sp.]
MRRLFWILVGAGLAVFVVLRGRQLLQRYTPKGIQEQVAQKSQEAAATWSDFLDTLRSSMTEREAELREELNIPARDDR